LALIIPIISDIAGMRTLKNILSAVLLCSSIAVWAQPTTGAGRLLDKLKTVKSGSDSVPNRDEVAAGLREALTVGTTRSVGRLSAVDGYFGNAALRILLPPEARKVEQRLRSIGMGRQVDNAIVAMNRAAEDAAKSATPVFVKAIREMTLPDALGILRGTDTAATEYLQRTTVSGLTTAFRPIIDSSLRKVDATRHWNNIFTAYNKVAREKVDPDLASWVTNKALEGLFRQLASEERLIRKDPVARSSELLRRVFRQ
jgi:hypothetical protein